MSKLKSDFFAVPDGDIYPRLFCAGDDVFGSVALVAEQEGLLVDPKMDKPSARRKTKAIKSAPENKAD